MAEGAGSSGRCLYGALFSPNELTKAVFFGILGAHPGAIDLGACHLSRGPPGLQVGARPGGLVPIKEIVW